MIARFSCHVTSDPSTCVHVTWSLAGQPVVFDGRRVYLSADGSLIVNVTDDRQHASSSLGAAYTCHVTNRMTSFTRQVRLGHDVINDFSDSSKLSWMSVDSVSGTYDL